MHITLCIGTSISRVGKSHDKKTPWHYQGVLMATLTYRQ